MRKTPARATILFCALATAEMMTAIAADAVRTVDDLPPGAGRDALARSCVSCHELGIVLAQGRTRAEWTDVAAVMIDRGAVISADDRKLLLDYLTQIAPPH
jgi:hypothetical protein